MLAQCRLVIYLLVLLQADGVHACTTAGCHVYMLTTLQAGGVMLELL